MLTQEDTVHRRCSMTRKMQSSERTLAESPVWKRRCTVEDPSEEQEGRGRV